VKASDVAITPTCAECGLQLPADPRRWRVHRIEEPGGDETPELGFWCEDCAGREFGAAAR
jgi:hypothetical protein